MGSPSPITIAEFKARFNRDFIYGKGPEKVEDQDITNALDEGTLVFNPAIWLVNGTVDEKKVAFLLLAAHMLVLNIQAAGGLSATNMGAGAGSSGGGIIQSKSIGSISLTYVMPDFVTKSPILSQFMRTDYGQKYLQMLIPRLVGGGDVVSGPVTQDIGIPNIPFF